MKTTSTKLPKNKKYLGPGYKGTLNKVLKEDLAGGDYTIPTEPSDILSEPMVELPENLEKKEEEHWKSLGFRITKADKGGSTRYESEGLTACPDEVACQIVNNFLNNPVEPEFKLESRFEMRGEGEVLVHFTACIGFTPREEMMRFKERVYQFIKDQMGIIRDGY